MDIVYILDKIGIIAASFAGVELGIKKRLDIFGLLIVGVVSAIGGGILRDILLARIQFAISHIDYLVFAYIATIITILLSYLKLSIPPKLLIIADTLGLSAFAAAGATLSLNSHLSIFHTILFATVTAVGGGLIRDIIINEVPFVLKKEVYATAAGAGGLVIHVLYISGLSLPNAVIGGLIFTIIFRSYCIMKNIHLPVIKYKNRH
jgi:uncharacterized membrane protein YeiH